MRNRILNNLLTHSGEACLFACYPHRQRGMHFSSLAPQVAAVIVFRLFSPNMIVTLRVGGSSSGPKGLRIIIIYQRRRAGSALGEVRPRAASAVCHLPADTKQPWQSAELEIQGRLSIQKCPGKVSSIGR